MQCSLSSFYFPCKNYYYTICIINIESLPFFIFFFQFAIYRKRNLTLVYSSISDLRKLQLFLIPRICSITVNYLYVYTSGELCAKLRASLFASPKRDERMRLVQPAAFEKFRSICSDYCVREGEGG